MRLKPIVPIHADDTAVQHSSIESVHCKSCLLSSRVLDKTEAARLHFDPVQSHYQIYYLAAGREEFEKLALQREEGEVADVEGS